MIKQLICLLLIFTSINFSCAELKPIVNIDATSISGIVIDRPTGDLIVFQKVSEFDNVENNTETDFNGAFEITFENKIPVLVIHAHNEDQYVEISAGKANKIYLDNWIYKNSEKVFDKANNLKNAKK